MQDWFVGVLTIFCFQKTASPTGQCCAVTFISTAEELVIRGNFCPCQTPLNFNQVWVSSAAFILKTAKLEFLSI